MHAFPKAVEKGAMYEVGPAFQGQADDHESDAHGGREIVDGRCGIIQSQFLLL